MPPDPLGLRRHFCKLGPATSVPYGLVLFNWALYAALCQIAAPHSCLYDLLHVVGRETSACNNLLRYFSY